MQHEALAAMEIEQAQQQFTANRHNKSKCWQSTLFFFLIERIYLCCPSVRQSIVVLAFCRLCKIVACNYWPLLLGLNAQAVHQTAGTVSSDILANLNVTRKLATSLFTLQ